MAEKSCKMAKSYKMAAVAIMSATYPSHKIKNITKTTLMLQIIRIMMECSRKGYSIMKRRTKTNYFHHYDQFNDNL